MKPGKQVIDMAIDYITKADSEGVFYNIAAGPNGPRLVIKYLEELKNRLHHDDIAIEAAWKILVDGYNTNDNLLHKFIDNADETKYREA